MRRIRLLPLVAAAAVCLAGCDNKPANPAAGPGADTTSTAKGKGAGTKDHEHGAGPHGGAIGEFGGKYHFEFTVSHPKQEATVYILGGDAQTPAPIKAESLTLSIDKPMFRVELKPAPQPGDPPGTSSRFVGKHEKLGAEQEFAGEVSGDVDGKPLAGEFEEKPEKK
jgi:hypothetical protein